MVASSIWTDPLLRPRGDGEHIFLADALNEVGRCLMQDSWTGREAEDTWDPHMMRAIAQWYHRALGETGEVTIEPSDGWKRLCRAMDWIAVEGAGNRLFTHGRLVAGGEYFDLPGSIWNVENLWGTRFSTCQVHHEGQPSYLFLSRASLTARLRSNRKAAKHRPHPSSFETDDEPLIDEMRELITSGKATGPYAAALACVDRARGGGQPESKARRLERRYQKKFGHRRQS